MSHHSFGLRILDKCPWLSTTSANHASTTQHALTHSPIRTRTRTRTRTPHSPRPSTSTLWAKLWQNVARTSMATSAASIPGTGFVHTTPTHHPALQPPPPALGPFPPHLSLAPHHAMPHHATPRHTTTHPHIQPSNLPPGTGFRHPAPPTPHHAQHTLLRAYAPTYSRAYAHTSKHARTRARTRTR